MADDTLEWDTLDSTTTYSCPGFDIRRETVRLPDGTDTEFDYLAEPESVVIIPFTQSGDLVVIEEWRQAVHRVNHGFPAGNVEPADASLAAAAHRELTEETGYVADDVDHLLSVEPANGVANSVHHYFVARNCIQNGEQSLDANESIQVDTTTFEWLYRQVMEGNVLDGRTVLGILYYHLHREA